MKPIKSYLQKIITDTISNLYENLTDVNVKIEYPKEKKNGDFATNIALTLTKKLHKNPKIIAEEIKEKIEDNENLINKIEIAGPGFINFFIANSYYHELLKHIIKNAENYGKNNMGEQKKVQVEFVSSNPTGPLHIGHGRQAVLGDVLCNILEWNGYDITREYYYNNAGNQMNLLGEAIYYRYLQLFDKKTEFPENLYQGDYIKEIARELKNKYNDKFLKKNEDNLKFLREYGADIIIKQIDKDLQKMGIKFDVFYLESSLFESGKVAETLNLLRSKGYTYEKDGATWLKSSEFGDTRDRVLFKNNGYATYLMSDIAYHREKFNRGFDFIINLHGSDHQGQVPSMKAAFKMLDLPDNKVYYLIHQMVKFIKNGKELEMSTRKGNFITISELIDELGKNVVRYFYLMRSADAQLVFDFDLAKKESSDNPAFYIQYAYARIYNIVHNELNKITAEQIINEIDTINFSLLDSEAEIDLLKELYRFPEIIANIGKNYETHKLPTYLHELANKFHLFYQKKRVLVDDPELAKARLGLCIGTQITLENGLKIIGIDAPKRM